MPSGDSRCKYCHDPIRWVDDEGRRLALNIAAVAEGGSYRVVGSETARRVKKADRHQFPKLYVQHSCQQWRDAKAIMKRERTDREAKAQPSLPLHVVPHRRPRR